MDRTSRLLTLSFFALGSLALSATAHAQVAGPNDARATEGLRAAIEAYQNLDLDGANARIRDARRRCGRSGCSASVLAQLSLMEGVIAVGGRNEPDAGLRFFTDATRADPSATIDPTLITPEISAVLSRARRQARGNVEQLLHEPVIEQVARTPVPIAVETGAFGPARVELAWRAGPGNWTRVRMERLGRGWGAEIPCESVRGSSLEYFVTAFDERDLPAAEAGNEDTVFRINIVTTRTRPAPALPGRLPPEVCRDANERSSVGGSCTADAQCEDGLRCTDSTCTVPPPPRPTTPLLALELGGGLGLVSVGGNPAYAEATLAMPSDPMSASCTMAQVSCPAETSGLAVTPYLWFSARAQFAQRFAVSAGLRFQPDAAPRTTLSSALISLRFLYAFTRDGFSRTGPIGALYAGTAIGQISPRAPGYEGQPFPATGHVITGLNNANFGARFEYGFGPGLRVGGDLALQFMFPRFVFAADITAFFGIAFL
ncbi:MAG: hypothetical protein Q8Q09_14665 [Deltaproteobacteria bacterium]|nr:hypothetical protein [Deltaproteobacteria bacterium]